MKLSILNRIVAASILAVTTSQVLTAQIQKAPADTGRIEWGHKNFQQYTYPSMCDRAGIEFIRYYLRSPKPDTSLEAILDSTAELIKVPAEAKKAIGDCISRFSPEQVHVDHLWGYIRSALLLGEDQKALQAVERAINEVSDSSMKEAAYVSAINSFFSNVPRRFDLALKYIDRLDALTPTPSPGSVNARVRFIQYWGGRYYKDSIRKYASQTIEKIHQMHPANVDLVGALAPYDYLINLANDEGNIPEQQKLLDSVALTLTGWNGGRGGMYVNNTQKNIDSRRVLYNKKANPITEGMWFNTNGSQWPSIGKISLIVLVDHTCGLRCWDQYKTIKRMKTVFGDDINITLATQSAGFSIGTFVLDEKQEGDSIVKLFSKVYDMNYAVMLDPRPVSQIPDGRLIRGIGPVAEIFNEWNGINAILTDKNGRIQWTGVLSGDGNRRSVITTIQRLLKIAKE